MSPRPCSVTIRGVTYPSQNAAARALGVDPGTVCSAKRANDLDRVGMYPIKYRAIIARLARASPEDFPALQFEAQRWLTFQSKQRNVK